MNMIADRSFESLLKVEVKDIANDASAESQLKRFRTSSGLLFLEPGREEALRLVGHLLRYSDQLIAVVGEPAVGKNHLLRAFADANQDTLSFGFVQTEQFMSASALSACIGQKLASRLAYVGNLEEWSAQIVNWSEELERAGSRAVIVIEDAQHLSESALEMLADLIIACSGSVGIRFILVGTTELREHLDHSRLVGQLLGKCHFIEVEPFDADTAAHFLSWSLASHALTPDLFTADERRYILQQGKGLPGLIRDAAIQVLDKGVPPDESEDESSSRSLVAGLVRSASAHAANPKARKWGFVGAGVIVALVSLAVVLPQMPGSGSGQLASAGSQLVRVQAPRIVPAAVESVPDVAPVEPVRVSPVVKMPPEVASAQGIEAGTLAMGQQDDADLPFEIPAESPGAGPAPAQGADAQERAAFLAKREPTSREPRTVDWLLEKSPETYVLQMLGTRSEAGARRYISEQEHPERFALFATRMNGKPWYVVVYGHHPDGKAARDAIQALPKALRDRKPWARSLESVHKAILEGRHA